MAAASTVARDEDESFLRCPVCHNRYNEPRLLPCIHRFCTGCGDNIAGSNEGYVTCPECDEEFKIPPNGFKIDRHMQQRVEFLQRKDSLKDEEERSCSGCGKTKIAVAFCFKCSGYLCRECLEIHTTMTFLKTHEDHILSVDDPNFDDITSDEMSFLQIAPTCVEHPGNEAQLCCKSCCNVLACSTCPFGKHSGHDVKDIHSHASEGKGRLKRNLDPIIRKKDEIYQKKIEMQEAEKEIAAKAENACEKLKVCCNDKISAIDQEIKTVEDQTQRDVNDLINLHDEDRQRKVELETEEVQRVKDKWKKVYEEDRLVTSAEVQKLQEEKGKKTTELSIKRKGLEEKRKHFEAATEKMKNERLQTVQDVSQHFDHTIKRVENLLVTSTHIVESTSDWTVVETIDDICAATGPLLKKIEKGVPDTNDMTAFASAHTMLDKTVDIDECKVAEGYKMLSVTSTENGSLVFAAGQEGTQLSSLTVIDDDGEITLTKEFKGRSESSWYRSCAAFDGSRVATVCMPDEVGLFDVSDGSYKKKNFPRLFRDDSVLTCVASDCGVVAVGCAGSKVHIFEGHPGGVKHLREIDLPGGVVQELGCLALNSDTLLACDSGSSSACAVDLGGGFLYKFQQPCTNETALRPISLCVDPKGFIYMLWSADGRGKKSLLVHYSPKNGEIVSTSEEHEDAQSVALLKRSPIERLVMVTRVTWRLFVYDIIHIDV